DLQGFRARLVEFCSERQTVNGVQASMIDRLGHSLLRGCSFVGKLEIDDYWAGWPTGDANLYLDWHDASLEHRSCSRPCTPHGNVGRRSLGRNQNWIDRHVPLA